MGRRLRRFRNRLQCKDLQGLTKSLYPEIKRNAICHPPFRDTRRRGVSQSSLAVELSRIGFAKVAGGGTPREASRPDKALRLCGLAQLDPSCAANYRPGAGQARWSGSFAGRLSHSDSSAISPRFLPSLPCGRVVRYVSVQIPTRNPIRRVKSTGPNNEANPRAFRPAGPS